MGPWPHYQLNVWPGLDLPVEPVTRPQSASPSVGTIKRHAEEQKSLLDAAFAVDAAQPGRRLLRQHALDVLHGPGLEELDKRRGDEEVTLAWVAEQMQVFVDTFPEFETPIERFATWLARLDDPED